MISPELRNLVASGLLHEEPSGAEELAGLVANGEARLEDAARSDLSIASRFDLAYNAAYAFALAGLRKLGLRSRTRYVVFQALPHTLGIEASTWRFLAQCHDLRNRGEYDGLWALNARLVTDLIAAAAVVRDTLRTALG